MNRSEESCHSLGNSLKSTGISQEEQDVSFEGKEHTEYTNSRASADLLPLGSEVKLPQLLPNSQRNNHLDSLFGEVATLHCAAMESDVPR